MRSCFIALSLGIALGTADSAVAERNDGSLDSIVWATTTASSANACPLLLAASVVDKTSGYFLSFTLKNVSGRALTFYRKDLPWGNVDSIQTAAVEPDGRLVIGSYPIEDDFGIEKVTVHPEETLKGDYDLSKRWATGFPHASTIVLMWAYKVRPAEIPPTHWPTCSGVTAFKVKR
jgi:hypothetical protein